MPGSKFSDLSPAWQACFTEGWQAFRAGNVPIGAAITDEAGQVLYQSRNRIDDVNAPPRQAFNSQIAHAELNTILLIEGRPPGIHSWHIYSLVEPCPLCMGAIYMSGLRNIHYAFPDAYAGSTNLLGATQYLGRKPVIVHPLPPCTLFEITAALQMVYNLKRGGIYLNVVEAIRSSTQLGITLGEQLFAAGTLQQYANQLLPENEVYDLLAGELAALEVV